MPRQEADRGSLSLRVADLPLHLDATQLGIPIALPPCHVPFLVSGPDDEGLRLRVRSAPPAGRQGWRPLYTAPDAWELWQDDAGRYVFVSPQGPPPRREAFVSADFRSGEVVADYEGCRGEAPYPLRDIEIVLFANWLSETGDLILHAAGVELDGMGYCFSGTSGAGKSTLANTVAGAGGARVLGEDNVILRFLDGEFWLYGTPWHLDTARCSAAAAPLVKLFFLDRTGAEGVRHCAPADGVARLMQTGFVPYYRPDAVSRILDMLALLAQQVPFFTLGYRLGADPVRLAREA